MRRFMMRQQTVEILFTVVYSLMVLAMIVLVCECLGDTRADCVGHECTWGFRR